jgi:toxin-antitoxin system PIN domain toxin
LSATVDANVLIYASNVDDPRYVRAHRFVNRLAEGPELIYLFWPTIMAYLRITTHPAILASPLTPGVAMANVEALLGRPHVRAQGEGEDFWRVFRATAGDHPRGNDLPDAHIVGLMRQHGVRVIYTRDRDFRRFDDIDARDPLA